MAEPRPNEKSLPWLAPVILFMVLCITGAVAGAQDPISLPEFPVLARVEVPGSFQDLNLPVYADLRDGAGKYYALVIALPDQLQVAGVTFQVIDEYRPGTRYLLAVERRPGARLWAAASVQVLYDDGRQILVRAASGLDEVLAQGGFALRLLRETPMTLTPPALRPRVAPQEFLITPNPTVSGMISALTPQAISSYLSGLSGETPVMADGSAYTLTSRHTLSGTPIQKASQYVLEQLKGAGLKTSFQPWVYGYVGNRNVVGELPGTSRPEEIVLLTAHLDDMPSGGLAPGADDNASGCGALLAAAGIVSRHRFQRTIRFVFFTGEEQGLLGSYRYAESVATEKIVAVLNLDMIGYNTSGSAPTLRLHTRAPGNPGYGADLDIATTFQAVVNSYGLAGSLQPIISSDGDQYSDHASFWDQGLAAIMAIEDDYDDFNPRYHTSSDKLTYLDLSYCTAMVKAALGATAHLAGPISPDSSPATWLLLSWQRLIKTPYGPHNYPFN
jgi:hypothetical protein